MYIFHTISHHFSYRQILGGIYLFFLSCTSSPNLPPPHNLLCNNRPHPLGVTSFQPQLQFTIPGGLMAQYIQIQVATLPEILERHKGDVWDTGKIQSSDSIIRYQGNSLQSSAKYYWRIRYWDSKDQISDYSEINHWEMGLLRDSLKCDEAFCLEEKIGKSSDEISDNTDFNILLRLENTVELRKGRIYLLTLEMDTVQLYLNDMKVNEIGIHKSVDSNRYLHTFKITPYVVWGRNCIVLKKVYQDAQLLFRLDYVNGEHEFVAPGPNEVSYWTDTAANATKFDPETCQVSN